MSPPFQLCRIVVNPSMTVAQGRVLRPPIELSDEE
jgi:hypothetical protein